MCICYVCVVIQLIDGLAEVFGAELAKKMEYTFLPGSKVAVFTYHGCTIKISFYHNSISFCRDIIAFYRNLFSFFYIDALYSLLMPHSVHHDKYEMYYWPRCADNH